MTHIDVSRPQQTTGLTERALAIAWASGDQDARASAYERFWPRLVSFLLSRGWGDCRADAEDIAARAWERIERGLSGFDPERPLWPWMASIATNAARDRFREENRAAGFGRDLLGDVTLVEQVLTDHRDHGDTIALRDALSTVLRALPERQRDALLARAYEGLSVEQAAGRFALSANAFRQLHFRATANARRAWSRAGAVSATRTS